MNSVLPIGTVVKIKDKKEKYVIIGKNIKKDDKQYDYNCVIFPYGFQTDRNCTYCFNDEDVEGIEYLGNINYK